MLYVGHGFEKAASWDLLASEGQEHFLPLVRVFTLAGKSLHQIVDVIGRAAIEAALKISAGEVTGEEQPGRKRDGGAAYHGRQEGASSLWTKP